MSDLPAMPHSMAIDHLPFFVTPPGQTDVLFNVMAVFMVVLAFAIGLLYLRLHALPEHLMHGASKMQFQAVGALALLALFTHNHLFWVAALLLALVRFPDFSAPLNSMARSLETMAGAPPPDTTEPVVEETVAPIDEMPRLERRA